MNHFRYQAIETTGAPVAGTIEAEDRKSALRLLGERGLFPSTLEICSAGAESQVETVTRNSGSNLGKGVRRKQITIFTREMSALLGAGIPIPQALEGLSAEEENPVLQETIREISDSVRKGTAFSAALDGHPKLFTKLYVNMVRVGEEGGVLPKVMVDLADLLEHEDEIRSEVIAAISYPVFVLCFGVLAVTLLLTFVLPRLFDAMQEMLTTLPMPTLVLLKVSGLFRHYWLELLAGVAAVGGGLRWYVRRPEGAEAWDRIKLRLPLIGPLLLAAALSRFARTLGTLLQCGVSLLPALKIVENSMGNRVLARQITRVAEETRGGDSLAAPLRKLGIFPRAVVQMIDVGEETGKLDEMLLKVAAIHERHMRARTKTLISVLAPLLIMSVGIIVGYVALAILLPIFRLSRSIH